MAAPSGTPDPGLTGQPSPERALQSAWAEVEERLRASPWSFEFFQAMRLLSLWQPHRQPVGRFSHPSREAARFGVHQSLAFPASQIQALDWDGDGPPRVRVNFFGLTGPLGVLPHPYTELLRERRRVRDTGAEAFLDIFNHRLLSLFYQAWEKARFPVEYERTGRDRFSQALLSLIGLGTGGLQDRQAAVRDEALLYYCGLLSLQPRSGEALRQVLSDYFDVPVEVEPFVGAWYPLDPEHQCRLDEGGDYGQMGVGAVVGDEVWDPQSRARVRLGPLTRTQYDGFLPDGANHEGLRTLTRFFSHGEIEFEAQLVLRRDEVPACGLGAEVGLRLGWETWMKSGPAFGRDPDDTVLRL